jgi:hypothetical protein
MDEAKAQQVVILSTFVTLGSTTGAELTKTPPSGKYSRNPTTRKLQERGEYLKPGRTAIAGFFAMLGCAVLAEFAPDAGAYLAILVAGGAFVSYGLPTLERIMGTTKEPGKYEFK